MMAAAFICLVPLGAVPAWVATIVVARDFLITGLAAARLLRGHDPAGGEARETQDLVADRDRRVFFLLLSAPELRPGARIRLVANRLALWRQHPALDYDRPNDLFRSRLSLASSRADLADWRSGMMIPDPRGLACEQPTSLRAPRLLVRFRRRLADTNKRPGVRTQKIVELAGTHRPLRAVITDEIELLVRIESFVRPVARSDQRTLLRSDFHLCVIACLRPLRLALANRSPHSWRLGHRRVGDVLRGRPPPRSPRRRSILPIRNWPSRYNADSSHNVAGRFAPRHHRRLCDGSGSAAPLCTAAQTAPRNSDLVALFSVVLPGNWSAIIWAAVNSRASTVGSNAIQKSRGQKKEPQNMSAVRRHRRRGRSAPGWSAQWFHRQLNESPAVS